MYRSAYGVLCFVMGNCLKRRDASELPKPPVRHPSDGEAKVKIVDDISSLRPPDDAFLPDQPVQPVPEPVLSPVSQAAANCIIRFC